MKFRKKPVVIEAEQWFPGKDIKGVVVRSPTCNPFGQIDTLEGTMTVSSGDWIITGVKGEKYPCKPDIFEMTYDRCDELEEEVPATSILPQPNQFVRLIDERQDS